jgi:hypothetical protein
VVTRPEAYWLLDLLHFLVGRFDDRRLLGGDHDVVDADRDAGAGRVAKPVYISWSAKITVSFRPTVR